MILLFLLKSKFEYYVSLCFLNPSFKCGGSLLQINREESLSTNQNISSPVLPFPFDRGLTSKFSTWYRAKAGSCVLFLVCCCCVVWASGPLHKYIYTLDRDRKKRQLHKQTERTKKTCWKNWHIKQNRKSTLKRLFSYECSTVCTLSEYVTSEIKKS